MMHKLKSLLFRRRWDLQSPSLGLSSVSNQLLAGELVDQIRSLTLLLTHLFRGVILVAVILQLCIPRATLI